MQTPLPPETVTAEVARLGGQLSAAVTGTGFGIRQVAVAASVSPGTIRNLLAGDRTPRLDVFARVAVALGLRVELDLPGGGPRRSEHRPVPLPPLEYEPYTAALIVDERTTNEHEWAWALHRGIAFEVLWVLERELRCTREQAAEAWGVDLGTLLRFLWMETSPKLDTLVRIAAGAGRLVVLTEARVPWRVMPWEYRQAVTEVADAQVLAEKSSRA